MAVDLFLVFALCFLPGLALTAGAAFMFTRGRGRRLYSIPLWLPLLLIGLAMTLVVPAAALFIGSVALGEFAGRIIHVATPTPTIQVTCYEIAAPITPTPTCYKMAVETPQPILGLPLTVSLARRELLERLAKEGRIPEMTYRRLMEKK